MCYTEETNGNTQILTSRGDKDASHHHIESERNVVLNCWDSNIINEKAPSKFKNFHKLSNSKNNLDDDCSPKRGPRGQ